MHLTPISNLLRLALILVGLLTFPGTAEEFFAATPAEIEAAMNVAQPGDTVTMLNGNWTNMTIDFEGDGVEGDSILLRAETPGQVILDGTSRLSIGGDYLVVSGLYFRHGALSGDHVIRFRSGSVSSSNHCRLTNTVIDSYNPPSISTRYFWVSLYGTNNRVDHCYFSNQNHSGVTVVAWLNGITTNHRIDHNFFGNRPAGPDNGWETIRIGTSDESGTNAKVIVEDNYFYKCDGEIEIISNKSNENIYRRNTFEDCNGQLTLRHGKRCLVEQNFFIGHNVAGSSGVRVIDRDHVVINNYFEGLNGSGFRAALSLTNGVPNSPLNRYLQVINAQVAFNTFVDCINPIDIGSGADGELSLPPLDCTIANNIVRGVQNPLIHYTATPINMTYSGNLVFGAPLGIPADTGLIETDPLLAVGEGGLYRPETGSPAIDAASGGYPQITTDVDGQLRDALKDIGADEQSAAPIVNRPLTAADVGPDWEIPGVRLVQVPPGLNTLLDSINVGQPFDTYALQAGGDYPVTSKILITRPVSIRATGSSQRPVIRSIEDSTDTRIVFEIRDGGKLYLDGLELDGMAGSATTAKYLIRTDDNPFSTPYVLNANDCYFHDVVNGEDGNFFRAYAGTFADSVVFTDCLFYNSGKEGIRLKDEIDDSGLYNVEVLQITGCTFWGTRKEAVFVYAGDNMPFTEGPKVTIDHCTFDNCGDDNSRIVYLRECDLAKVKNSLFTNSPNNLESVKMAGFGTVFSYSDTFNIGPVSLTRSGNLGAGMVNLDPLYADRLNGDFTLPVNSPVAGLGDDGLPLGDLRWVGALVGIAGERSSGVLPQSFALFQNYPNPFNPATRIEFTLAKRARVKLEIFRIDGSQVTELAGGELQPGVHGVNWDASGYASGVYLYRLTVNGQSTTRKLLLLK